MLSSIKAEDRSLVILPRKEPLIFDHFGWLRVDHADQDRLIMEFEPWLAVLA